MQQDTNASASPDNGHAGTRMVDRIKDKTAAQLNVQKNRATEGLGTVASAVRETTQNLRTHQHDVAARYVEEAADQLERLSNNLRQKDVTELLADAQRLARRRPALFVGAAFALGLLGARFLKSSAEDIDADYRPDYRHEPLGRETYERHVTTTPALQGSSPVPLPTATERL